jgi:hypothetical protein
MNIVKQKWEFLNSTLKHVSPQVIHLYQFGLETLVDRVITSFRANARLMALNWNTAKSKIYRLSANAKIPQVFITLLKSLDLVGVKDVICVDFSDFGNGFQVLMFAKQTRKGRAIPLYFEILRYPIERGSQNLFIIQAIENFSQIIGCKPKLVFDRGFACPTIIHFMAQNKYKFIVRTKKGKSAHPLRTKKLFLLKNSKRDDRIVKIYKCRLRLIISDQLEDMKEPWYLITNDFESGRETIVDEYYHRFEIEEFFRDAKRLLGLENLNVEKSVSLSVVLWFTILGIWFLNHMEGKMSENDHNAREAMQLSRNRYIFEQMQREYIVITESKYLVHCG